MYWYIIFFYRPVQHWFAGADGAEERGEGSPENHNASRTEQGDGHGIWDPRVEAPTHWEISRSCRPAQEGNPIPSHPISSHLFTSENHFSQAVQLFPRSGIKNILTLKNSKNAAAQVSWILSRQRGRSRSRQKEAQDLLELCAEHHKEGPSSIEFSCTSLFNYLVSDSNFESWVKLLGPALKLWENFSI